MTCSSYTEDTCLCTSPYLAIINGLVCLHVSLPYTRQFLYDFLSAFLSPWKVAKQKKKKKPQTGGHLSKPKQILVSENFFFFSKDLEYFEHGFYLLRERVFVKPEICFVINLVESLAHAETHTWKAKESRQTIGN